MIAYLDASVLLRVVLRQPDRLPEWKRIGDGVASAIVEVECLRTLDRLRLSGKADSREIAVRRDAVYRILDEISLVGVSRAVIARAGHPSPSPLGSLDAIHLATALLWRDASGKDLVLATHDRALAFAARASGLQTIGVSEPEHGGRP
jgi:predicted nucleic acid-binding protein